MIPVALVLALAAEVDVTLTSETTCTTTVALFEAIDAKVPLPIPLHVDLEVRATGDAIEARIGLDIAGTSTTSRSIDLAASDCPLLPRLVASIAERYVTDLPHRDWASFRRERRLAVVRPPPPKPPSPPFVEPVRASVSVEGGVSAGLDTRAYGATFLASLSAGRRSGAQIAACVGATGAFGGRVGDGSIDVLSVFGGLGPAFRVAFEGWSLMSSLRFVGGVHHGRGRGFDAASATTLPLFDVVPHVSARVSQVSVAAMIPVSIAQPRFVRASTGDGFDGPRVRLAVTVGWSWDVAPD